jgi:hypothetical protein
MLDSAAKGDDVLVNVIDITEPMLRAPLDRDVIVTLKLADERVVDATYATLDPTVKWDTVTELPPLVNVIAILPAETLELRLLKVIL